MREEINEDNAMWRAIHKQRIEENARRRGFRTMQIRDLTRYGFEVVELTDCQFRINGVLDLYPTHNRYHDLAKNKRGGYRDTVGFVMHFFHGQDANN